MQTEEAKLWDLLATFRNGPEDISLRRVIEASIRNGLNPSVQSLSKIASRLGLRGVPEIVPPKVGELVVELIRFAKGPKDVTVLDPWSGQGLLLRQVWEGASVARYLGIHPNVQALNTAKLHFPAKMLASGDLREGTISSLAELDATFDVIATILPIGMQRPTVIQGREVRTDEGGRILVESALRLRDDGLGLYVLPSSFFSAGMPTLARNIEAWGLYVEAAFHFPAGTFRPLTDIETYLVVVRKGARPESIFVASGLGVSREETLRNFQKGMNGKEPALGAWVALDEFRGLVPLVNQRAFERKAARSGFPSVRLGDIATIRRVSDGHLAGLMGDNSFYFRLVGTPRIEWEAASLGRNFMSWATVEVDPVKADANVVAGYLGSPLGRLAISSRQAIGVVGRLSLQGLREVPVVLPELDVQQKIRGVDHRLRALAQEAEVLREMIWSRPQSVNEIEKKAIELTQDDSFSDWLETLPFPLASILWTFHTRASPAERYVQLDYFFEAITQFLATLVFSAIRGDANYVEVGKSVMQALKSQNFSIRRPTVGAWLVVYEKIAKEIRRDANSVDREEYWKRRFACDDGELLKLLIGRELISLLKRAAPLRNSWRGHGGYVSEIEAARRENAYLDLLHSFRSLVSRRWEDYPLVLPGSFRRSKGILYCRTKLAMGTRTPFPVKEFELDEDMDDEYLYFVGPFSRSVLKLEPFFVLGPSPREQANACYFYNRLDGDGPRFVAYQYSEQSEITEPKLEGGLGTIFAELEGF